MPEQFAAPSPEQVFLLFKFVTELLIATILFVYSFPRRNKFPLRAVLSLLMCFAVSAMYNHVLAQYFILKILRYILLFIAVTLAVYICFDVNFRTALFCTISGYATQHFAVRILYFVELYISVPNYAKVLIYVGTLAAVYSLSYILFARRLRGMRDMIVKRGDIVVLCVLIVVCMIVISQLTQIEDYTTLAQRVVYLLYGLITSVMIFALQYGIFKNAVGESERKELERIRKVEKRNYEFKKETIELVNIKCHDLKRQLSALGGRGISESEIEELKKRITLYDFSLKTGNDDLDLVIAEHAPVFQKNNIDFEFLGEADFGFMAPSDIYSLFVNALDNVVEAVLRLPEEERYISVNIKRVAGQLSVHIENPYDGTVNMSGSSFLTLKDDKNNHGYGIASMRMTVKKYRGSMYIDTADNLFRIDILFPLLTQSV